MNTLRTAMLLAAMTALFMGVGYLIGGSIGMTIAFLIAAAMNLFSYWNADKMVLRMHRAVEVDERSAPEYFGIVRDLAARANLPMPKVYLIDNAQPNAFATGRNPQNAAVAATTGLLQRLTYQEVAGVMAHELAHVQNRDTLTMTITATLAGAISMLGNFALLFGGNRNNGNNQMGFIGVLVAMIVAPFAAMIVQMAISRTREYAADRRGAEICGHPLWLASALDKIARAAERIPNPQAERNPATAPLFIINPLSGARMDSLFSTHPNTDNRIAALEQMAGEFTASAPQQPREASRTEAPRAEAPRVEAPRPQPQQRRADVPRTGRSAQQRPAPTPEPTGPWGERGAGQQSTPAPDGEGPWGERKTDPAPDAGETATPAPPAPSQPNPWGRSPTSDAKSGRRTPW